MNGPLYLKHLSGMACLTEWLQANDKQGYPYKLTDSGVTLPPLVAQRFAVGTPRSRKFGQHPFFAAQRAECAFLGLLNITKVMIRDGEAALHFFTPYVAGHGVDAPDLPPFHLSIFFDNPEKVAAIAASKTLACCRFWMDEDGAPQITAKDTLWVAPVVLLAKDEPLITEKDRLGPPQEDLKKKFF